MSIESNNNFPDKMMEYQKRIEEEQGSQEVKEIQLEAYEKILDTLLPKMDSREAQQMQDDFEVLKKVVDEQFEEKGGSMKQQDIMDNLPQDNIWHSVLADIDKKYKSDQDVEGIDFDAAWENIKNQTDISDPEESDE